MLKKNKKNKCLLLLFLINLQAFALEESALEFSKKWGAAEGRPYFKSHDDFLSIPLSYPAVATLRGELEKREATKLLHSEESHLNVITPSEWRILKQRIKMDELEKLALKNSIMKMNISPICLARIETLMKGKTNHAWVLLAESPELRNFRRDVWRYYLTKGGASEDFQWKDWHPCITIGYTDNSYDEEMVMKDKNKCSLQITMTP